MAETHFTLRRLVVQLPDSTYRRFKQLTAEHFE